MRSAPGGRRVRYSGARFNVLDVSTELVRWWVKSDDEAAAAFPCAQVQASQQFPSYHVMNNLSTTSGGGLALEGLNDANAIFMYKGVLHVSSTTTARDFDISATHDTVSNQ